MPGPNPPPPGAAIITVRAVDPFASEPGVLTVIDQGVFEFSRTTFFDIDMTVYYKLEGMAKEGTDYSLPPTPRAGSIVIPAGRASVRLPIQALHDDLAEGVETVVVRLEPIACIAIYPPPRECYLIGQPSQAVVYIRDDQRPVPRAFVRILSPMDGQRFPSPAIVPIQARAVDPDGYFWRAEYFANDKSIHTEQVAYYVAPTNGTPFLTKYDWKDVPAGQYTLTVQATTDKGVVRTSQPVHIVVGPPPPIPPVVSVIALDPKAIEGTNCWGWWNLTNRQPDGAVQYTAQVAGWSHPIWWFTNCGPKNAAFSVRRWGPTNETLRVFFALKGTSVNGKDYELVENSVVLAPGERKKEVLIVPKDDEVVEAPETVIMELTPPPYASPLPDPYQIGWPARAGAVIVDSARPWLRPVLFPDRSFYLGVNAMEGGWYRIERSTNFVHWMPLCTNVVVQGTVDFLDPDAASSQEAYYRAVPAEAPPEN